MEVLSGERTFRVPGSGTCWPLASTVMPESVTLKPRARSRSWSSPIAAPAGTLTFLSRMARLTTAPSPIFTLSIRTESMTLLPFPTKTSLDRTEPSTTPPEMTTPLDTMESRAVPTVSF
ncbi:hypothetical protein AHiyo4_23770 [Arthrobacter sp. Hiyo4]|nr:hypothetical protein AHiyo4_23770 [Arthrobacter sp. Hiyo4]